MQGNRHPLAVPQFDQGAVDPSLQVDHVLLIFKPSPVQQTDLDQLLSAQQNPSSPEFHKWLSPETFAERFGVSASDNSKIVAWLQSEGLTVKESARGRNWIAFSGAADQVSTALHTSIHRYRVNGQIHVANATEPAVPEALAEIVGGFLGLDDFYLKPQATDFKPIPADPNYNRGTSHYLVPEDFATIYNVAPLYKASFDGTGQGIAIVGQSAVLLSDIRSFRARYNLPANDPKLIPYGNDPGFTDSQLEGNLDLEWAGAIAPNATIYYVYGASALAATVAAVNSNVAPVISISYGNCEIEFSTLFYRAVAQQANAQGITIVSASGDSGAAGCDSQGLDSFATRGRSATFPSNLPEITGVGGTQFDDASGSWWSASNSPNFGSALSYIPELAWNESSAAFGLLSSGGGVSTLISKPDWQAGPGVPNDKARDMPDLALAAALHDAYYITFQGLLGGVGGTSASAPSLAGILALLNQYQTAKGFLKKSGLGNINPQLYRLAQSAPSIFHDIVSGDNVVPCAQGTPDCLTGSYGYPAAPGYDLATGLGSIDANNLVTQWDTASRPVTVTISAPPARITVNETVQLTVTVVAANGTGTPTGTVNFNVGSIVLGSAALTSTGAQQTATLTFQAALLGAGTGTVTAVYAGDAGFSGGSASVRIQITRAAGESAIVPSVSRNPVYAAPADAQGLSWQTLISLKETAGIPTTVTSFTIDGQPQSLAQYFPSTSIPASGTLTSSLVLRNLAYPLTRKLGFTGMDSSGLTWTRELAVTFFGPQVFQNYTLSAAPLTMLRNPAADPACQWSQQLSLDETGGFAFRVTTLVSGSIDISEKIPAIFGTARLAPYGSLQGTLCWGGITPPASNNVFIVLADEFGNNIASELTVSFAGPAANPTKLSAAPASLTLQQSNTNTPPKTTLAIDISDKTQSWTATVFPANRTTAWLSLSQYSGTGPAQIVATASEAGFEPGVYRALITLQSAGAVPQIVTVPVMFILGSPSGSAINGTSNALSFKATASPGMIMSVFGSQLANSQQQPSSLPLPYVLDGVSAAINGIAAPLYYTSSGQLNIQVPYEIGIGPAVLGVNNHGQISGYQLQIASSAPGIAADAAGNMLPATPVQQGKIAILYMTGEGDVTPALRTGSAPTVTTAVASLPKPRLPLTVTVAGAQAFLQFVGVAPGLVGLTQVNFIVPNSVPAGVQQVVVTVGGISAPPVKLTVEAASPDL